LDSSLQIPEMEQIIGQPFFLGTSYTLLNFDKKWVGLHFRQFFHKLIWSPCASNDLVDVAQRHRREEDVAQRSSGKNVDRH
jgi:hypothetical protein